MTTDPLNLVQNMVTILPSVDGTRHYVTPASKNGKWNGHSIDNMVEAVDKMLTPEQQRASDEAKQRFNPNIKW
ncbi:hypothetical protein [Apibacter adventoris]|uniref:Uncharacterized protein n=1 Tax=Apibacter adventoris TaxID=1679466 RepID=A0A2S8A4G2_9FLAO|nr:hypothetical protein [Apibacter adventoris]PQL89445.1 hypothetical protein C4S77_12445 [Apibacter adventoris]PQL94638.1 hypothetical protein C4S77_02925 [Apibacter adventoris]PQL94741.1 hypothetical protein C4S77_02835 [Apibacter adventoris]PQL94851.1 hypothetical protein C4S77_02390 [Apibacter adventoris]